MARAVASGRSREDSGDTAVILDTDTASGRAGGGTASTHRLTSPADGRHHRPGPGERGRRGISPPLLAAALATGGSALGLQLTGPVEWTDSWRNLADLYLSLWLLLFVLALAALWALAAALPPLRAA